MGGLDGAPLLDDLTQELALESGDGDTTPIPVARQDPAGAPATGAAGSETVGSDAAGSDDAR
jgi:hypothetical protein